MLMSVCNCVTHISSLSFDARKKKITNFAGNHDYASNQQGFRQIKIDDGSMRYQNYGVNKKTWI